MAEIIKLSPYLSPPDDEKIIDEFEEVTNQIGSVMELSTDELIIELTERLQGRETLHSSLEHKVIIDELWKRHFYLNNLLATASIRLNKE